MEWYCVEYFRVGDEASSIHYVLANNEVDAVLQFIKQVKIKLVVSIVRVILV